MQLKADSRENLWFVRLMPVAEVRDHKLVRQPRNPGGAGFSGLSVSLVFQGDFENAPSGGSGMEHLLRRLLQTLHEREKTVEDKRQHEDFRNRKPGQGNTDPNEG